MISLGAVSTSAPLHWINHRISSFPPQYALIVIYYVRTIQKTLDYQRFFILYSWLILNTPTTTNVIILNNMIF